MILKRTNLAKILICRRSDANPEKMLRELQAAVYVTSKTAVFFAACSLLAATTAMIAAAEVTTISSLSAISTSNLCFRYHVTAKYSAAPVRDNLSPFPATIVSGQCGVWTGLLRWIEVLSSSASTLVWKLMASLYRGRLKTPAVVCATTRWRTLDTRHRLAPYNGQAGRRRCIVTTMTSSITWPFDSA